MWVAAVRMSKPGQAYHGIAELTDRGLATWTGVVKTVPDKLDEPLRWKRPRLIFVNSMSDLFHESLSDEQIDAVVAMMALADQHTYQTLTKRPKRMREYFDRLPNRPSLVSAVLNMKAAGDNRPLTPDYAETGVALKKLWPLPNVWWGTSVGTKKGAADRLADVIACRHMAAVLWLSVEPLLEDVAPELYHYMPRETEVSQTRSHFYEGVDWIVVGGESGVRGGEARPMELAWARGIRDLCKEYGVRFHMKQLGGQDDKRGDLADFPPDLQIREWPATAKGAVDVRKA